MWRARKGKAKTVARSAVFQRATALRIATALVLAPIALATIWAGGWWFVLLLLAAALAMAWEWPRLVGVARARIAALFLAVAASVWLWSFVIAWEEMLLLAAAWLAGLGLGAVLLRAPFWTLPAGGLYIGAPLAAMVWFRFNEAGTGLVLYVLGVVAACDIGAYAAGRTIGGAKLAPRISPKKTWAGLGGGIFAAMSVGALFGMVLPATSPLVLGALGGALAIVAQGGDLFVSYLKRRQGLKDTGALLPGHGGVLDRIDGVVAALVGLALLALVRGGASPYRAALVW